jgi:hypothetical protein
MSKKQLKGTRPESAQGVNTVRKWVRLVIYSEMAHISHKYGCELNLTCLLGYILPDIERRLGMPQSWREHGGEEKIPWSHSWN